MSKAKSTTAKPAATLTQWDRLVENLETVAEREMTDAEMKERERLVKGMKKSAGDFEKRYPGRGKEVMYATATKQAMGEAELPVMAVGSKVMVPHKGKKVAGKVVRYDKGDMHGSPFYIVDVGEYGSIKVPAESVMKDTRTSSTIQCVDCGASLSAKEKQKASHTCDACDLAHRNDFDRRRAYDDDDDMDMQEAEMTGPEKKERERLVKGMKKGDWSRYGERAKDVMYATATKQAMGEDQKPYPWECMKCGNKWRSTESGQVNPVRCPKCGASGEDDILPGVFSGPGSQSGGNLNKAPETFTVMAIDDTNPEYKRVGSNYKPNVKVLDQMHSLEKSDVMHAAKMFRQKHPKATISVENKGGKIVKVFKPGEMIKEAPQKPVDRQKAKKTLADVVRRGLSDLKSDIEYDAKSMYEFAKSLTPMEWLSILAGGLSGLGSNSGYSSSSRGTSGGNFGGGRSGGAGGGASFESKMMKEADMPVMSAGARVMVPHKGKKVAGKVVRYDKGDTHGSPFYIIDVGEYASIKVPAHQVMQEAEHDDDTVYVDLHIDNDDVSPTDDQDMMLAQLDAIASRARKLHQTLGQVDIHEVPAWIQDKVSNADHNMSAILDYYMYETTNLTEAEKDATTKEVAWFLQPAHIAAKTLNGNNYTPVGIKPEDIINNAIIAFLKSSHTTETWKLGGATLTALRDVAGISWDESLIKPSLMQAMGITSITQKSEPESEPEPEKAPKETSKVEPPAKETPKAVETNKSSVKTEPTAIEPEKKDKKDAAPKATTESIEIEIKLQKPMDEVTFQQKRQAALDFAAATCPGMKPNGVTSEQIVNNAVSVWFHKHPIPLDAELEVLGDALEVLSKLGIDWNFHLVPPMYLQTLKLPNVKVTEVDEKDTSAAGKKIEKLEDIVVKL